MNFSQENHNISKGGFQNRDIGQPNFPQDFGNDYGVDFARFCDTPNPQEDARLQRIIADGLQGSEFDYSGLKVRNGFVFIAISGTSEDVREELTEELSQIHGVKHVHVSFL